MVAFYIEAGGELFVEDPEEVPTTPKQYGTLDAAIAEAKAWLQGFPADSCMILQVVGNVHIPLGEAIFKPVE